MYLKNNKLTLIWAIVVGVLSLLPASFFPEAETGVADKVIHALFYLVLTVLLIAGNIRQTQFEKLRNAPVAGAFLISVAYGGLIELLQDLPAIERNGDWQDMLANMIGTILGYFFFRYLYGKPYEYVNPHKVKHTRKKILGKKAKTRPPA